MSAGAPSGMFDMLGQIASTIIGGTINSATTFGNNALSQKYYKDNQASNYAYNEMAADAADQRARSQWRDMYSPQAQMQNIKEAGLSPSMMFGGTPSPGGSAQGAMGNGANGPQQQVFPFSGLEAAQIGAILAQTAKTKAETKKLESEDKLTAAKIAEIYQETDNKKMYHHIMSLDAGLKEVQLNVAKATESHEIDRVISQASTDFYTSLKVQSEAESADWKAKFDAATYETNVKQLAADYNNTLADTANKWANITLSEAQVESLVAHIAIDQYNSDTSRMTAQNQIDHLEAQIEQWCVQNGIAEATLKHEKTKKWLQFSASIFGSICNVAKAFVKPRF